MFIKRGDGKIVGIIKADESKEDFEEACEKAKKVQAEQEDKKSSQSGDN